MARRGREREPAARTVTVREEIRRWIRARPMSARDLAEELGLREGEAVQHLRHLERSLRAGGTPLLVEPAECVSCGFVFEKRARLNRPSRCPRCRKSRIDPPRFRIGRS